MGCRETPVESSICAHAIRQDQLFEIPDLTADPRFEQNPLVTGPPDVRFYAGAVLRTSDGVALGTVCVLDRKPRRLSAQQRDFMQILARQTMSQFELRRALHHAAIFQERQTHFMAITGHDLRQPLQTISASIEFSLRSMDSPAAIQLLKRSLQAVKKMGRELDDLANAAGLGAAVTSSTNLVTFRVDDLFASLSPSWQQQGMVKGLQVDVVPSSATVVSDRRLLNSILGNLVGNAIKYTHRGRVLIGCRRRKDGLELCVLDTGVGISKADQTTIFTAFRQIDPASDGLGLGLALVKQAAALLQVPLKLSSIVGRGSCFSLIVPYG